MRAQFERVRRASYGHYINISQEKTPYPPTHINTSVQSFRVTCCRSTGHPIPAQTVQQSSQTHLAAFRRLHVDYTWVTAQQWSSDACCTLPEHVLSHRNCKALGEHHHPLFWGLHNTLSQISAAFCRLHVGYTSWVTTPSPFRLPHVCGVTEVMYVGGWGAREGVCMLLGIAYSLPVRISHLKCEMRMVRTFEMYVHFDARVVY